MKKDKDKMEEIKEIELEPIDATQCQCEIGDVSFMSFGLRQRHRCPCIPTWVGVQIKDGSFYGAMSLCSYCKEICESQLTNVSFQKLSLGG